jgi:ribosomal protein L11 methyltransferase
MQQPRRYTCFTITAQTNCSEQLADFITETFSCGLEFVDSAGNNSTTIRFYLAVSESSGAESHLQEFLHDSHFDGAAQIELSEIEAQDWEEAYRRSVKAERVGDHVLVRPTWVTPTEDDLDGIETEIVLDPKMAFGTGSHGTTRLCMLELHKLDCRGAAVADVGCGSGILAILAAKRWADAVLALDIDPIAVENSIENSELNNVADTVRSEVGSTEKLAEHEYDIVVANIILGPLLELLPKLQAALKPGGHLILSGLLEADSDEIEAALLAQGLSGWRKNSLDEWRSYTVVNPHS